MTFDQPRNAREAFYRAIAELGVHRDMLQTEIGRYLQAVKDTRARVERDCPMRLWRFDKAEAATTEGLVHDLSGDEPLGENVEAQRR